MVCVCHGVFALMVVVIQIFRRRLTWSRDVLSKVDFGLFLVPPSQPSPPSELQLPAMARTQSQQASFYIDVPPLASIAVKRKVKALPQPDRFRPLPTSNVVVEIPPSPWKTAHARAKQLNQNAAPVLLRPSTNMSTMTSTDRPRPLKEKNSMDTVISHFDEPGKPQDLKKRKMEVVENETDRKKQRVQLSKVRHAHRSPLFMP